jgi:hypothetical protein
MHAESPVGCPASISNRVSRSGWLRNSTSPASATRRRSSRRHHHNPSGGHDVPSNERGSQKPHPAEAAVAPDSSVMAPVTETQPEQVVEEAESLEPAPPTAVPKRLFGHDGDSSRESAAKTNPNAHYLESSPSVDYLPHH